LSLENKGLREGVPSLKMLFSMI